MNIFSVKDENILKVHPNLIYLQTKITDLKIISVKNKGIINVSKVEVLN